jgi:hypothetical protein
MMPLPAENRNRQVGGWDAVGDQARREALRLVAQRVEPLAGLFPRVPGIDKVPDAVDKLLK